MTKKIQKLFTRDENGKVDKKRQAANGNLKSASVHFKAAQAPSLNDGSS